MQGGPENSQNLKTLMHHDEVENNLRDALTPPGSQILGRSFLDSTKVSYIASKMYHFLYVVTTFSLRPFYSVRFIKAPFYSVQFIKALENEPRSCLCLSLKITETCPFFCLSSQNFNCCNNIWITVSVLQQLRQHKIHNRPRSRVRWVISNDDRNFRLIILPSTANTLIEVH
jgi:hypothetical protein